MENTDEQQAEPAIASITLITPSFLKTSILQIALGSLFLPAFFFLIVFCIKWMFSHLLRSKSIPQHKHFLHSSRGTTQTAKGRDQYHTIFSCLVFTLNTVTLPESPRVVIANCFKFCTSFAFMFQISNHRCVCLNR